MKKFSNYEQAKERASAGASVKLPVGAYICKVMCVKYEEYDWGDRISVQFDISEGEHKDFFKKQYESSTQEDKKWKGVARINVPTDDGSEQDTWKKNRFAAWTNGFEKSNNGYSWDWDEKKWKGKTIGIVFREMNKMINGSAVTYTEAFSGCPVSDVENGTFYQPNPYFSDDYDASKKHSAQASEKKDEFMSIPGNESEEIPF